MSEASVWPHGCVLLPQPRTFSPFRAGGRPLLLWVPSQQVLAVEADLGLGDHHEPGSMWLGGRLGKEEALR